MSALPDLAASFHAMEALVEAQPEGITGEIARGVFAMSPRPRFGHGVVQGNLFAELRLKFGAGSHDSEPDWLFAIEPEIRSEHAYSRLVPDLAAWRKSTTGWPASESNPVTLIPDWVAGILSPTTEDFDRGNKKSAYGLMGVAWLWLVDADARRIEVLENVRGVMKPGLVLGQGSPAFAPPFGELSLDGIFL